MKTHLWAAPNAHIYVESDGTQFLATLIAGHAEVFITAGYSDTNGSFSLSNPPTWKSLIEDSIQKEYESIQWGKEPEEQLLNLLRLAKAADKRFNELL